MSGWPVVALGDVADVIAGQSPKGEFYNKTGAGTPFYQGKKDFGPRFLEPPSVWTSISTKIAQPGDILMSVRAPVGPVNLAVEECCIGRGLAAIRTYGPIDRDFLFYYFRSKRGLFAGTEGAVFDSINKAQIQQIEIPLPPLDEQKRIVAKLDQAQSQLDRLESKLDLQLGAVDDLWRAALNHEIAVGRVNQGNTCPASELGVSRWPAVPLGSVVTILGGGTPSKAEDSFWNGPIPWASVRDLKDRWLSSTEFQISEQAVHAGASRIVPAGNVVICTRVGLGKVVQARFDVAINQDLKGLIPKEPPVLSSNFLYYWYQTIAGQVIAMGTGATVQGVKLDDISSLLIPLPPLDEQKRIVAKLDDVQQELAALRERLYGRRSLALSFWDRTFAAAFAGAL